MFEEFAYKADSGALKSAVNSSNKGSVPRIPQRQIIPDTKSSSKHVVTTTSTITSSTTSKIGLKPPLQKPQSISLSTKRNNTTDDGGWLDARSGGTLTSLDRKKNIFNAQLERKKNSLPASSSSSSANMSSIINRVGFKSDRSSSYNDGLEDTPFKGSKPIKKLSRTILDDDESIDDPTPEKIPSSFNRWNSYDKTKKQSSQLIQEVREMERKESLIIRKDAERKQARKIRLIQRSQLASKTSRSEKEVVVLDDASPPSKRPAPAAPTKVQAEIFGADSEDSDSDSDQENQSDCDELDYDLDDEKRRLAAEKVLEICENLSTNLRDSLQRWEKGDHDSAMDSDVNTTKDCVDLTFIKSSGDSSVLLRNEDVQQLCPGLELKAYQLVGVNWLKLLHQNKVNGVLADDMGLGKTIQTISFLAWLKYDAAIRAPDELRQPHFIVVPASTLANWQNEFAKFCPSFVVVTYHGTQKERAEMRHELRESIEEGEVDVILSTYTIFERESGKSDRAFLVNQQFEYLVLDEAHCIKNSSSSRFSALNAMNSSNRLLLSGTPVQNDLKELLALLRFLMPAVFTQSKCALLISEFGWDSSSSAAPRKKSKQSAPAVLSSPPGSSGLAYEKQFFKLKGMLAPFVLRRLKGDVLDQLSDKVSVVERLEMTPFQRQVYEGILSGYAERKEVRNAKVREQTAIDEIMDCKPKKNRANAKESTAEAKAKPPAKAVGATLELLWKGTPSPKQGTIDLTCSGSDVKPKKPKNEVVDLAHEPEGGGQTNPVEVEAMLKTMNASEVNHLFTALRKAANHPLLLRIRYNDEDVLNKIAMIAYNQGHFGEQCDFKRVREEIDSMSDYDIHLLCLEYPNSIGSLRLDSTALYDSPKMMLLRDFLPKLISQGHRMLIFSQWTRILDLLEVLLEDMELDYLRLDGSTPIRERQEMIDLFSSCNQVSPSSPSDCTSSSSSSSMNRKQDSSAVGRGGNIPIFLLSTKAGGLGINLTAADTVIMHDLDFNPENDRQAEDRCHRIGQNKAVTVYRLVTVDTVDEDIFEIGEQKRKLTQAVLSEDAQGRSRPSGSSTEEGDTISKILQRALLRRRATSREEATS
eukprot:gene21866-28307_t